MLFPKGKRPDEGAIKRFAKDQVLTSITFNAAEQDVAERMGDGRNNAALAVRPGHTSLWVELLREGLSFDLDGLAPGPPNAVPPCEHHFDFDNVHLASTLEALHLHPGAHLQGAQYALPVLRAMIAITRDLMQHFEEACAVVWPPSRSMIGRRYFESSSSAWLDGGVFPALGLTAFREMADGGLQSVGLEQLIGQELRIEPPLSQERVEAIRLGIRLINQLVMVGGIEQSERVIAPDGTRLIMRPSRNGRFIRVSRE